MIKIGYLDGSNLILPESPPKNYLYISYVDGKYQTFNYLTSVELYVLSAINNNKKHIKYGIINVGDVSYTNSNVIWIIKIKDKIKLIINEQGWLLENGNMLVPTFRKYVKPPNNISL